MKIVVNENNIILAVGENILLLPDLGIINPGVPDEAGNIWEGERLLYINDMMDIIEVEDAPSPWVSGAYSLNGEDFVLNEESEAWKNYLQSKKDEKIDSVPQSVTMRQARLALLQAGKLSSVAGAIELLPSPQKEIAHIEWEFSSEVFRNRPLVQALGPLLGLSEDDLDDLFILAGTL